MTQDEKLGFNELFPMPRPPMSYLKYFNATAAFKRNVKRK